MVSPSHKLRRSIASVLLVVYGTVGILGYGLHELFHVHHGHSHLGHSHVACGNSPSSCCSHSHSHARHCDAGHNDTGHCHADGTRHTHAHGDDHQACSHSHQVVRAEKADDVQVALFATEHDCAICAFLAQAQEITPEISESQLITAVPTGPPANEVLFPLHLPDEHLARGPPNC